MRFLLVQENSVAGTFVGTFSVDDDEAQTHTYRLVDNAGIYMPKTTRPIERRHFPETWIWSEKFLKENESEHSFAVQAPDTITSWIADGFALSSTHPISFAQPATLRVFQPFFITLLLPYSVFRGEKVKVRITVYNYLTVSITTRIMLEGDSTDFLLIDSEVTSGHEILIPEEDARSIDYLVVPKRIGRLPLKCTAISPQAGDSVVKTLLVEPEGVKKEYSQSSYICLKDNECVSKTFNLSLPLTYVPDSETASAHISADLMGPTIKGLESLLRLPHGCGEQNMILFAPSVYVTQYLSATNILDRETKEKALKFIQTGYQTQMTFQREDGSYSIFGESDSCGSMWLTSFVVRSFSQARGIIDIEDKVQKDAVNWMKRLQNRNGSFPSVCRVWYKEMQGCSAGGEYTLTAYATLGLLEAGVPPNDKAVALALEFLESVPFSNCQNNYLLAMRAYVFCKANHSLRSELLLELQRCAADDSSSSEKFWRYSNDDQHCYDRHHSECSSRSCDVETTAYALLAFTCNEDVASGLEIVRWLARQRNPRGGFKSTQDTVVALQALFSYASAAAASSNVNTEISISSKNGFSEQFSIGSSNWQDVFVTTISSIPSNVDVRVCGFGCLLVQMAVKYNIPKVANKAAFAVTASAYFDKQTNTSGIVEICSSWLLTAPRSSNMALTDVSLFSGFVATDASLRKLENEKTCNLKKIETENRNVRFYLDEVQRETCCIGFKVRQTVVVENLQQVPVVTYNYYNPDQSGGTMLYIKETDSFSV